MPIMDGFKACRLIRQKNKDIKIIALSADKNKDIVDKCKRCGFSAFMAKPVQKN